MSGLEIRWQKNDWKHNMWCVRVFSEGYADKDAYAIFAKYYRHSPSAYACFIADLKKEGII